MSRLHFTPISSKPIPPRLKRAFKAIDWPKDRVQVAIANWSDYAFAPHQLPNGDTVLVAESDKGQIILDDELMYLAPSGTFKAVTHWTNQDAASDSKTLGLLLLGSNVSPEMLALTFGGSVLKPTIYIKENICYRYAHCTAPSVKKEKHLIPETFPDKNAAFKWLRTVFNVHTDRSDVNILKFLAEQPGLKPHLNSERAWSRFFEVCPKLRLNNLNDCLNDLPFSYDLNIINVATHSIGGSRYEAAVMELIVQGKNLPHAVFGNFIELMSAWKNDDLLSIENSNYIFSEPYSVLAVLTKDHKPSLEVEEWLWGSMSWYTASDAWLNFTNQLYSRNLTHAPPDRWFVLAKSYFERNLLNAHDLPPNLVTPFVDYYLKNADKSSSTGELYRISDLARFIEHSLVHLPKPVGQTALGLVYENRIGDERLKNYLARVCINNWPEDYKMWDSLLLLDVDHMAWANVLSMPKVEQEIKSTLPDDIALSFEDM